MTHNINDPKCADCPHPRSAHDSDGCEVCVEVGGWEYFCGCNLNDCETDDDGTKLRMDDDRYRELLSRRTWASLANSRFACAHPSRREIAPAETEVRDGQLLEKHLWWCKDCDETWTTDERLGDVDSIEVRVNLA